MTYEHLGKAIQVGAFMASLSWANVALPADGDILTASEQEAIHAAAASNNLPALYGAIFAAIAKAPDRAPEVVAAVVELVPDQRDAILKTITTAFPQSADQITAAASPPQPEEEKLPWSFELQAGGVHQSGNDPLDTITAAATLTYSRDKLQNDLGFTYDFAEDNIETTTRRFVGTNQTAYDVTDDIYAKGRLRYIDDKNDGYQWQANELFGPGYRLFNSDDFKLSVEGGPGFRQQKEKSRDGGNLNNDPVGWVGNNLNWNITDNTEFSNSFLALSSPEGSNIDNTTAFTIDINEDLSFRLSFEVRYNSNPSDDAKKTDTISRGTIVYNFNKPE